MVFDDIFYGTLGEYPILLKMAMHKDINLETFVILNKIFDFVDDFDNRIQEKYIWPMFKNKTIKYGKFIDAEIEKYVKIIRDKADEYRED